MASYVFFDGKQETVCGHADGLNNSSRSYNVESIPVAERVWLWCVEKNKRVRIL